MTQAELVKLGFKKVPIDDYDSDLPINHYYYASQFGDITFISSDNDEAELEGKWYVTTPCQSLKFYMYSEIKTVIDIFNRNKIS
tara:strand:+ start:1095 stop:1346 length:252 start_codon:yes stop_codon:yes gene_type:complete